MSDDLVKRLRRYGEWLRQDRDPSFFNLVTDEAADRIEKLENQFKLYFHAFNKAASRIEKLEAELHSCFHRIEELQAALRKIADANEWLYATDYKDIARAAVEGKKE